MWERTSIVNFLYSVDIVLVSVGRRNLGGLSNDKEGLSTGQHLWIELTNIRSCASFIRVLYRAYGVL